MKRLQFTRAAAHRSFFIALPSDARAIGGCGSQFVNSLYFNMVTLTTVGFGDIGPSGPAEKVCGTRAQASYDVEKTSKKRKKTWF